MLTIQTPPSYVELLPGGSGVLVSRSNRLQFVKSFVKHALYGSAAEEVKLFVAGLKHCFSGPAVDMCSLLEVKCAVCGPFAK